MSKSTDAMRRRLSSGRYPILVTLMLFVIVGYAAVLMRLE
ncbi:hypothetical protein MTDSW087_00820 [Methylobacterium dankookense]|uniref:Uncharacterized protein n=1 Tax=Methylobacterium dankookense TaxID=560405 RepID=A0A564FSZ3_9HYPH|nr:hypothetical protein IFDJLNFL_4314 [Methylobacterium dankookense]VUF11147.1 hypothetical protein MTDSW087_00820 [Methylobacterium dankookense]